MKIKMISSNSKSRIRLASFLAQPFKSEDEKMMNFVNSVVKGNGPDAVIMLDVNPAYTLANGSDFASK